jgi:hypothetical protein
VKPRTRGPRGHRGPVASGDLYPSAGTAWSLPDGGRRPGSGRRTRTRLRDRPLLAPQSSTAAPLPCSTCNAPAPAAALGLASPGPPAARPVPACPPRAGPPRLGAQAPTARGLEPWTRLTDGEPNASPMFHMEQRPLLPLPRLAAARARPELPHLSHHSRSPGDDPPNPARAVYLAPNQPKPP